MSHLFGENTCMYYSKKTQLKTQEGFFLTSVEIPFHTTKQMWGDLWEICELRFGA